SKFGWERFINGFLDLLSVQFISRFGKKPMHFFGTLGTLTFFLGFIIVLYLIVGKILYAENFGITNKPSFYLALTTMIVGTIFFATGFIAELVSRTAVDRNLYLIEETLGFEASK